MGHLVNLEVHQPIANDGVPPEGHFNFHEDFMVKSRNFTGFNDDVMEISWDFMVTSWDFMASYGI